MEKKRDNLPQEDDVSMRLADADSDVILSSLTHLYSNPVLAALREYFANAMDAHQESNKSNLPPIEVNLAHYHAQEMCLRIRDYGKGMTEDQLVNIFAQYGASTKRTSNKSRGGFGLGSKSGLAVSDHVSIITIQQGNQISVKLLRVISEDGEERSVIRSVNRTTTDAPDGTEILVPITKSQNAELVEWVNRELSGYDPETYRIDGSRNEETISNTQLWLPITEAGITVGHFRMNTMSRFESGVFKSSYGPRKDVVDDTLSHVSIMMGGIFYPKFPSTSSLNLEDDAVYDEFLKFQRNISFSENVVLDIPVGSVKLPPHRDTIIDTRETWKTLFASIQNFNRVVNDKLQLKADSLDFAEAMSFINAHHGNLMTVKTDFINNRMRTTYEFSWRGENYQLTQKPQEMIHNLHLLQYRSDQKLKKIETSDEFLFQFLAGRYMLAPLPHVHNYVEYLTMNTEQTRWKELSAVRLGMNVVKENGQISSQVSTFISRNLSRYCEAKYGTSHFAIVLATEPFTAPNKELFDEIMDMDEAKAYLDTLPKPTITRSAPVAWHGILNSSSHIRPEIIDGTESMPFFGGKDSLNFIQDHAGKPMLVLRDLPKVKSSIAGRGHAKIDRSLTSLSSLTPENIIILDFNKSVKSFMKNTPDSSPLALHIMESYDYLTDEEKEAVHDSYSMHIRWREISSFSKKVEPFSYGIYNTSFRLAIQQDRLFGMGAFLAGFLEPNIPEYVLFRQQFVAENDSKRRAGEIYYPVYTMTQAMRTVYALSPSEFNRKQETASISDETVLTYINNTYF
jgi:hypothetical protein